MTNLSGGQEGNGTSLHIIRSHLFPVVLRAGGSPCTASVVINVSPARLVIRFTCTWPISATSFSTRPMFPWMTAGRESLNFSSAPDRLVRMIGSEFGFDSVIAESACSIDGEIIFLYAVCFCSFDVAVVVRKGLHVHAFEPVGRGLCMR